MKIIRAGLALILMAGVGTSVQAKDSKPSPAPSKSGMAALQKGLDSIRVAASPPGQSTRPVDPDQGDDHASLTAIQMVCSKDTPAAQRSAICNRPISP